MPLQKNYPMIVKLHGKHDPTYYVTNSAEEESRAYYDILMRHQGMGYYPTEESVAHEMEWEKGRLREKTDDSVLLYVDETHDLDTVPEPLRSQLSKKVEKYRKKEQNIERSYAQDNAFVTQMKKVMDAGSADEAIKLEYTSVRGRTMSLLKVLIDSRNTHEYEWVETIFPQQLP